MTSESKWRLAVASRFPARPILADADTYDSVWAATGASREEVAAVLELLEVEYGLPPEFFRPEDSLEWLLEPLEGKGFWSRATNEVRAGDRQLELSLHLERRCKAHGISMPRNLATLRQFVRACSGLTAT